MPRSISSMRQRTRCAFAQRHQDMPSPSEYFARRTSRVDDVCRSMTIAVRLPSASERYSTYCPSGDSIGSEMAGSRANADIGGIDVPASLALENEPVTKHKPAIAAFWRSRAWKLATRAVESGISECSSIRCRAATGERIPFTAISNCSNRYVIATGRTAFFLPTHHAGCALTVAHPQKSGVPTWKKRALPFVVSHKDPNPTGEL